MPKRVKVLEFDKKDLDVSALFYELALSPESHAAGGITRHADGRVVITLDEEDFTKLDLIKQKLGEPKKTEEKETTNLPPPPPEVKLSIEQTANSEGVIECPFCHVKLTLKHQRVDVLDGAAKG
ncbi:MAG: hypothetical protein RMJ14_01770 [Nitrososphaerota archaeon]|nr:hypothetical protein [Aigarchaeota archaeon]MDW8076351.1 hypothetical protein [Nitrososphaerota archaeon]